MSTWTKHSFHSDNWWFLASQTFQAIFIKINLFVCFMNFFLHIYKRLFKVVNNFRFWKVAFQEFRVILPKKLFYLAFSFSLMRIFRKFFNVFERKLKFGHIKCTSSRRNLPFRLFMSFHEESIMFLMFPSFVTGVTNVKIFTE